MTVILVKEALVWGKNTLPKVYSKWAWSCLYLTTHEVFSMLLSASSELIEHKLCNMRYALIYCHPRLSRYNRRRRGNLFVIQILTSIALKVLTVLGHFTLDSNSKNKHKRGLRAIETASVFALRFVVNATLWESYTKQSINWYTITINRRKQLFPAHTMNGTIF